MDRTGIAVVLICVLLIVAWMFESQKYHAQLAQQQAQNTNVYVAPQAAAAPVSTPAAPGYSLSTNPPERLKILTNSDARYTFTSRGGGLKSVELLKFPETITPRWKKGAPTNGVASLNTDAPVPVMAILGDPSIVGDGDFTLTKKGNGIEAEKSLPNGLVITKDFELSSNYLVNVSVTLKNDSGKPLSLPQQEWVIGTATPMDVDDFSFSTFTGGTMWYDGNTYHICSPGYFSTNTSYFGIIPRTPKTVYTGGASNVIWGATYNQFFALMAMPKISQPADEIIARPVDLPAINNQTFASRTGVEAALVYPAQSLAAEQVLERQIVLFAGPKELPMLARIGDTFKNRADLVWNLGSGYATFWGVGTFFAKILLSIMNWMHAVLPWVSYGWIIVLLTILLRASFYRLTASSMRSMKKMQALAPELKALKEKYSDDPSKYMQKQGELFRKNQVNPMGGCLPMIVQMPVFIGFYIMLRTSIELRGAHFLWVTDLTKPDTLFIIPGLNIPFNLLPLLMVGVMVWQAHLQPVSPGVDPSQQKMMRYMPLIFLLFFYNYAAGMALYMTISTLAGIVQIRLIKNIQPEPVVSPLTPPQKKKK